MLMGPVFCAFILSVGTLIVGASPIKPHSLKLSLVVITLLASVAAWGIVYVLGSEPY